MNKKKSINTQKNMKKLFFRSEKNTRKQILQRNDMKYESVCESKVLFCFLRILTY